VAVELVGQRLGLGGEQVGQNDSAALGLEPAGDGGTVPRAPPVTSATRGSVMVRPSHRPSVTMRTGTRSASSRAHAVT